MSHHAPERKESSALQSNEAASPFSPVNSGSRICTLEIETIARKLLRLVGMMIATPVHMPSVSSPGFR